MDSKYKALAKRIERQTERPDIFLFRDYRAFLQSWLEYLKNEKRISLRKLCAKAEISPAYLPNVFQGHFPLSENALEKLTPHLELNENEIRFLGLIRNIEETKDELERQSNLKKAWKALSSRGHDNDEARTSKLLEKWYYTAIREMSRMPHFKKDPKWIQTRLKSAVPLRDIKNAIKFLEESGYISEKTSTKRTQKSEGKLEFDGPFYRLALRQYHEQMLELQAEANRSIPRNKRTTRGFTIAIPEKKFSEIKAKLQETLEEIVAISKPKSGEKIDTVYQINLGAFPIAGEDWEEQE